MPKQMTKEERAAYQREYRAKRKLEKHNASAGAPIIGGVATSLGLPVEAMPALMHAAKMQESVNALGAGNPKDRRIEELTEQNRRLQETIVFQDGEIARLKQLVTARPGYGLRPAQVQTETPYNERPVSPAPKKGK